VVGPYAKGVSMKRGAVAVDTESEDLTKQIAELEEENADLRLQLAVLGSIDVATGLANRIGLLDAIEMASFRLARMAEPFAVVVMQFPQLDVIDDPEEHLDAVCDIGALLAAGMRSVDRVGRVEGSTFVSVLANIPSDDIPIVLRRSKASFKAVATAAGLTDDAIDPAVMAVSLTDPAARMDAAQVLDKCYELMADPTLDDIQRW